MFPLQPESIPPEDGCSEPRSAPPQVEQDSRIDTAWEGLKDSCPVQDLSSEARHQAFVTFTTAILSELLREPDVAHTDYTVCKDYVASRLQSVFEDTKSPEAFIQFLCGLWDYIHGIPDQEPAHNSALAQSAISNFPAEHREVLRPLHGYGVMGGVDHYLEEYALRELTAIINRLDNFELDRDIHEREVELRALRERLHTFVDSHHIEVWRAPHDTPPTITVENLSTTEHLRMVDIHVAIGSQKNYPLGTDKLSETLAKLEEQEFLVRLDRVPSPFCESALDQRRLQVGSKGAHLEELTQFCKWVEALDLDLNFRFFVPDFEAIPASVYEKWSSGEDIRDELRPLYRWVDGRSTMVRSSAVHSEDNDNSLAPGIYHSERIDEAADFETFYAAVQNVMESTHSKVARHYRAKEGFKTELMGVMLHEYVPFPGDEQRWIDESPEYINTVRFQVPSLLEVVTHAGDRGLVVRDRLLRHMAVPEHRRSFSSTLHFQLDRQKADLRALERSAIVAALIERYFGKPMQIELRSTWDGDLALFQVRPLPSHFAVPASVVWPADLEPLREMDAIGVGDFELNILSPKTDNSQKKGLVIFEDSHFGSLVDVVEHLPQEGAVLLEGPSTEFSGHIETLCAQRGIICLFDSAIELTEAIDFRRKQAAVFGLRQSMLIEGSSELDGHTQVRVVADGLTGKVYPVEPDLPKAGAF